MPLSTDQKTEKKKVDAMEANNIWLKKPWLNRLSLAVVAKPHYFGR